MSAVVPLRQLVDDAVEELFIHAFEGALVAAFGCGAEFTAAVAAVDGLQIDDQRMRRLRTAVEVFDIALLVLHASLELQLQIGLGLMMGKAFLHLPAKAAHKIVITD